MALFRRSPGASFTAAATQFKVKDPLASLLVAQTRQTWQSLAYAYYSTVGEIHYATRFVGNSMSRVKLVAARKPDAEDKEPTLVTDGPVADAVRKLSSPRGGQAGLIRATAMNLFIAGECYLIGTEDANGRQTWDACSINELIFQGTDAYRRQAPALPPLLIDSKSLIIRMWNEHPEYSLLADSSLRSCMDECEKLLLLSRADKAIARSRFAGSGMLFMPSELLPPASRDPQNSENNPFLTKLTEVMMTALIDDSDPSSVVPFLVVGPADYGAKIRYITFDRPLNARAAAQRMESIQRIATAIDLPAEVLTGKADLNHWTAWQINEDTTRSHLQPGVELICDAFTSGYLRPALEAAGYDDADEYMVWYDASNLTQSPDKSDKAQAVYDRGALAKTALRRHNGFGEDEAPSEEEYKQWVGVQVKDESSATGGPIQAPAGPGGPMTKPSTGGTTATPGGGPSKVPGNPPVQPAAEPPTGDTTKKTEVPGMPTRPSKPPTIKNVTSSGRKAGRGKAPARNHLGRKLAQIDADAMQQLKKMSHTYLATRQSVTAAIEDLTDELGLDDQNTDSAFQRQVRKLLTAAQLAALHEAAVAISDKNGDTLEHVEAQLISLYGPQFANATATASAALFDELNNIVTRANDPLTSEEPQNGEDDGLPVKGGLLRAILGIAGGAAALAALSRPHGTGTGRSSGVGDRSVPGQRLAKIPGSGVATGDIVTGALADNGITPQGYIWSYGSADRPPFNSHEDLDGEEFSSFTDSVLELDPEDSWLDSDYYAPGDHPGCMCHIIINFGLGSTE